MRDLAIILAALTAGALVGPAIRLADIAAGNLVHGMLRRRLRRTIRGAIVLTYDDGPGIDLQPRLLRVLAETGTRATFYVCGMRTSVLPDAIAAIRDAGHELGDHGFAHLSAFAVNAGALRRDDLQSETSLRQTGAAVPTYRPPYGRMTFRAWWRQRRRNRPILLWTHDAGDLLRSRTDPITFAEQIARDGGGVVLMHGHDRRDGSGHDHVLAATRAVVAVAAREGIPILTAGDFVRRGRTSPGNAPRDQRAKAVIFDSPLPEGTPPATHELGSIVAGVDTAARTGSAATSTKRRDTTIDDRT